MRQVIVDGSVLEDVFEQLDAVILESFVNRATALTVLATIIGDILDKALVLLISLLVFLLYNVGGLCLTACGVQEREHCKREEQEVAFKGTCENRKKRQ